MARSNLIHWTLYHHVTCALIVTSRKLATYNYTSSLALWTTLKYELVDANRVSQGVPNCTQSFIFKHSYGIAVVLISQFPHFCGFFSHSIGIHILWYTWYPWITPATEKEWVAVAISHHCRCLSHIANVPLYNNGDSEWWPLLAVQLYASEIAAVMMWAVTRWRKNRK